MENLKKIVAKFESFELSQYLLTTENSEKLLKTLKLKTYLC